MITKDDIKLLVASGEGYNAEFKVSVPAKVKELTEEVCAFANAAGGVLLIGVNDANELKGVTIDNAKRSAIQNSLSEITPQLACTISFVEVDSKTIGVIEVPSGPNKPYVLSGAIYVRIGPNTQKLTTAEQMRDFFQQADKIYFDEAPCREFSVSNMLDADFLSIFKAEAHISAAVPDKQLFANLKLFANDAHFKNGAVLFFGQHPELILDKAITRCIAFQGTDKRFIMDDKPYGGNLYQQYRQAMQWLKGKLNVRYDIEGQGGGPRKEIWEIPETVFKEAIINALSHRDYYDKGAVINIELFDDRVEISNPGGLVSAISEAEFGKRSHSRNPLIFGLFARMHFVEQVGSGIGRIQELMKKANLPEPVFQKEGIFTVILMRPVIDSGETNKKTRVKTRVKTREKILEFMNENPNITLAELAEMLGITKRSVEKQVANLKKEGLLKRIDSDKTGYWSVSKNLNSNE
jgi:ATP-dependent DNA helicase RecG